MAYQFFIDGVELPVTPGKLSIKIKGRNETMSLISGEEINIPKRAGLTEVEFDALLPYGNEPYTLKGHEKPMKYVEHFKELKAQGKPFLFQVIRTMPWGETIPEKGMEMVIESFDIDEDAAKNGLDILVGFRLKQYRPYRTKTVHFTEDENGAVTAEEQTARPADTAPVVKTYTVKAGDCLWNIAKQCLGDGGRWREIYELNRDKIRNPNQIFTNQVLALPEK